MGADTSWVAILGAVAGVLASLRWFINDVRNFTNKPKLVISEGPSLRNWHFIGTTQVRRFVNFEVASKKGRTARRCVAKAIIIQHPANITHLEKEYTLHWADVPYSTLSTGAEPVDIGLEPRRLDIVFTVPNQSGKSWLAMPLALTAPGSVPQATLPQGEYILKVLVSCENGSGDAKTIKLISPDNWQDLQAEEVKNIR